MANPTPGHRPDWVDPDLFPFESRFLDVRGSQVHYVDEGTGPTLLLLHGNPTWSFLYRDLIRLLRDDLRCVALDYPGFGLSSAAPGYGYTAAEHAAVVEEVVERLDLTEVTVMMQDWGGPIGTTVAARHPGRYSGLVIANTWAWPLDDVLVRLFSRLMGGMLGRIAFERLNLFARAVVPVLHRRRPLTRRERAHYTRPFPDPASRVPVRVLPRELTAAGDVLREAAQGLERLAGLPALLVWALRDPAFDESFLARWQAAFPHADTTVIGDAGHYLQDDAPDDVAEAIRAWWPGGTLGGGT